ncbi:YLS9 protein [Spatholobus suberectus]|nr:YLS9 protein [Spatholobus suberectus]
MADRVRPRNSSPLSRMTPSRSSSNPSPPAGTYVIHVPKDQVHHLPPPGNARRYGHYARRETRRCRCCCCLCWLISVALLLAALLVAAAAVFYLIFKPQAPHYALNRVAVKGMNLASPSSAAAFSPEFDVEVRADNGNEKIGIYYADGSSVEMFYNDVRLCDGALPAFYQPSNNVTVFETVLTGNGVELAAADRRALAKDVAQWSVPLMMKLRAPVKVRVGSVKTWTVTVKVGCDVTLDQLTAQAKIVNKDCSYGVDLW